MIAGRLRRPPKGLHQSAEVLQAWWAQLDPWEQRVRTLLRAPRLVQSGILELEFLPPPPPKEVSTNPDHPDLLRVPAWVYREVLRADPALRRGLAPVYLGLGGWLLRWGPPPANNAAIWPRRPPNLLQETPSAQDILESAIAWVDGRLAEPPEEPQVDALRALKAISLPMEQRAQLQRLVDEKVDVARILGIMLVSCLISPFYLEGLKRRGGARQRGWMSKAKQAIPSQQHRFLRTWEHRLSPATVEAVHNEISALVTALDRLLWPTPSILRKLRRRVMGQARRPTGQLFLPHAIVRWAVDELGGRRAGARALARLLCVVFPHMEAVTPKAIWNRYMRARKLSR